jgi:hypothetical protein
MGEGQGGGEKGIFSFHLGIHPATYFLKQAFFKKRRRAVREG